MTEPRTGAPTFPPGGREVVMSFGRINLLAIPVGLAVVLLSLLPFTFLWGFARLGEGMAGFFALTSFLPAVIVGIVVHEVLHGITWALAGHRPLSSIRFGFNVSTLTPYAHFTEPLPATPYRLGAAMPGLVLGVIPVVIALATGNGWLAGFGTLFLVAASGDIIILWMLRDVPASSTIQDHPSKPGCIVYDADPSASGTGG
ncbi:MAG: hypothetical protein H6Q28_1155 [Bacteroidetes bacterium]|nr:hypothetical protein [Bacteroidota bacterium]